MTGFAATRARFMFALARLLPVSGFAEIRIDLLAFAPAGNTGSYGVQRLPLPPCHAVLLRDGTGAEAAFAGSNPACGNKPGFDAVYAGYAAVGASTLTAAAGKLKAGGYTVLLNKGWRQGSTGQSPVLLRAGKTIAGRAEIEATLDINGSTRLPEVTLDIVLTRLRGDQPEYLLLHETRRLKPGEPHYFDHPQLGAILQISDVP